MISARPTRVFYHSATGYLLRAQTLGLLKRIFSGLKSPRKRFLAVISVLLGFVWISQAVTAIFLRQPADPEAFQLWLPLGLMTYAFWHFFRLATKEVEPPYSWSPAEREFVIGSPLSRPQQITYRLLSVASAAVTKALCFAILMIPDLPIWWTGFLGMLVGLVFVDLIRICGELFFFGLGKRDQMVFRSVVISSAVIVFLLALTRCFQSAHAESELASPGALVFFRHLFREFIATSQSSFGLLLLSPFKVFSTVALTHPLEPNWWLCLAAGITMVSGMFACVYRLDKWMLQREAWREKEALLTSRNTDQLEQDVEKSTRTNKPPVRLGGAGSLAWRQLTGAMNYWKTIAVAMILPIFLSCLPLVAQHSKLTMLLHVSGASLFYSFLLMPSALILDFRRDINRMVILKALPLRPISIAIGQLTAPVLICWMFQFAVLLIALLAGKIILWQALVAWFMMFPVTLLIFAIENWIFLLSPFQRNKEGFDVFLRTILTFTGKCLGFVFGVGALLGMFLGVTLAGNSLGLPPLVTTSLSFGILWLTIGLVGCWFVLTISRQFQRFDPSQDVPGVG